MWPSEETASRLYDLANWGLIAGLVIGVVSTILVVWMGNTKEAYLRARLATADVGIATAQADAAKANLEAESLRKDNLILQKDVLGLRARTEYRHLTLEQQTAVRMAMKQYEGQNFGLIVFSSESDSSALGDDIRITLDGVGGAGWKLAQSAGVGSAAPETGVVIKVRADASERTLAIANKLANALRAQGLFVPPAARLAKDPGMPLGMVLGSAEESPIIVMIGRRP